MFYQSPVLLKKNIDSMVEDNKQLTLKLEKKIQTLKTLMEFSRSMSMATSMKSIYDIILLTCMGHKGIEVTGILLKEEDAENRFYVASVRGTEEIAVNQTIEFSSILLQYLLKEEHVFIIDSELDESPQTRKILDQLNCRLLVPLFYQTCLMGILSCSAKLTGQPFLEEDIEFLQLITGHTATAIKNIVSLDRLEGYTIELEKRIFELNAVDELNRSLSASLDVKEIVHTLILTLMGHLTAGCGVLYMNSPNQQEQFQSINKVGGVSAEIADKIKLPLDIQNRISKLQIIQRDAGLSKELNQLYDHNKMEVCFFLDISDNMKGLCFLGEKATGMAYQNKELELAALLIQQAVSPINNAILYREVEQRVIERTYQLEAANKSKSMFLANMSHEIRTPMNAIIGMSNLMMQTDLSAKQEDYQTKVLSASKTLLGLINDILDFTKIDAGKLDIEHVEFDLNEILNNLSNLICVKIGNKEIELLFNVSSNVPRFLVGDPLRLEQILINLTNNAVKFTKKGEIIVSIDQVAEQGENITLRFSVQDSGIGISPEKAKQLFSPFTQLDGSMTRKYGGTGLGLAICKNLVELMGGEIVLDSQPGKGATFTFSAIFGRLLDQKIDYYNEKLKKIKDLKLLIVDDSKNSRDILENILTSFSFECQSVASGKEALAELKRNALNEMDKPYDLVILDWNMPQMNGLEIASKIRNNPYMIFIPKIIMMTVFGDEKTVGKSKRIGVEACLVKPVSKSSLFNIILEMFDLKREVKPELQKQQVTDTKALDQIKGARILLVEDNEINQQVARELLQNAGMIVTIVNNGKEAVEALENPVFDVVLMDLQMPVMDGYSATRRIREQKPELSKLPIIAMTAHARVEDRNKCLDIGMNDHVTKPIDFNQMLNCLIKWIPPGDREISTELSIETFEQNKSEDLLLPDLAGIDMSDGLLRSSGNKRLFKRLLFNFKKNFAFIDKKIQKALDDNNIKNALQITHAIKGVSGNIGAVDLFSEIQKLESSMKQGNTADVSLLLDSMAEELNRVMVSIGKFEESETQKAETKNMLSAKDVKLDTESLRSSFNHLYQLLLDCNIKAGSDFVPIKETLQNISDIQKYLEQLEEHIQQYDFDYAIEDLINIAQCMNISLS